MKPEVIVHNSVSLDGCATGFEVDVELHYEVAGALEADASLLGSETARTGLELFGAGEAAKLAEAVAPRPEPSDPRPLWALVDSRGLLMDKLHGLWGSGFCRGLVVAVAESTPPAYLDYLRRRQIEHHVLGGDHVDLARFIELLGARHGTRRLMVDAGPALVGVLLDQGLVDRLSLIVAPKIAAASATLLGSSRRARDLQFVRAQPLRGGCVHLEYRCPAATTA